MKRIILLLALASVGAAHAQQTASAAENTEVESRLETLEKRAAAWEKIAARLPRFSGYVQAGYQWNENASTFFLKRVRLTMAGDIMPKVDYRIQFEFTKPQLVDAYVQYRPFRELNIKAGEYKIPFSIENTDYSPTRLEFIDYPLVLLKMMGFGEDLCGISSSGRDLGATLWGGFIRRGGRSIINYDLGVFNGAGLNCKDSNKSKDIAARLTIKPVDGLLLSGSYYHGEYAAKGGPQHLLRERYGAGVCYDRAAWVVRGEWIGGRTGRADAEGRFDSDGWYVMAGWRAPRNFMPVARFDTFTQDRDRWTATTQNNYTAGLLWAPVKHLRCQLNYTYEDYKDASAPDRNVVSVMVTGMF